MQKLTREQAKELLSKGIESIKKFIEDNSDKPKQRPDWADGCFGPSTAEGIATLKEDLVKGFNWSETQEGYNYWCQVYDKLVHMEEELREC